MCLVWRGGHSKHLEICVAMSAGKKDRMKEKEKRMIDENERKEKRGKGPV